MNPIGSKPAANQVEPVNRYLYCTLRRSTPTTTMAATLGGKA